MGLMFSWWVAIEALGIVGLPLTALLFANLPDRGWAFAKPLSLLLVGWLVWFPLSVVTALPFSRMWIFGTFLAFALVNLRLLRVPGVRQSLRALWAQARGYIFVVEGLFAAAFALMGWIRSFTPGAVDTEKFMDLAFLSSIWRAPHLPPPDPWLSGQPINYYYFGHFLLALVAKALDTQPAYAFNLGIALIFGLTAVAVFGVAANLFAAARRGASLRWAWLAGLTSVALVLVVGNLASAGEWWQSAVAATTGSHPALSTPIAWWWHRDLWSTYDWWCPSRVFHTGAGCATYTAITEFPAFSFVLADLHAHVLALPFVTLAVGIALNLLLAGGAGWRAFGAGRSGGIALVCTAIALGALYAINGWDLPTYLGLALLALAIQQWLAHDRRIDRNTVLDFVLAAGALAVVAVLAFLPFYRGFTSPAQGIGLVPPSARSPVGYEVGVFGIPAFLVLSFLVWRLARWQGALVVGLGAAALLLLTRATGGFPGWTLVWGVLLVAVCAALALRQLGIPRAGRRLASDVGAEAPRSLPRWRDRSEVFVYCLVGTAAALVVACEIVYLRDVFSGGDLLRMNTIFKLYYQAWLLVGLAAGPITIWLAAAAVRRLQESLAWVGEAMPAPVARALTLQPAGVAGTSSGRGTSSESDRRSHASATAPGGVADAAPVAPAASSALPDRVGVLRWTHTGGIVVWMALLIGVLAAGLIYPVLAVSARTASAPSPRTLDGAAYMATDPTNMGDAAAISWLNTHVTGEPVIVEAAFEDDYQHYARVSAFTGLSTLMGWPGHELQWRVNWLAKPGNANVIEDRLAAVKTIYTDTNQQTVLATMRHYHAQLLYVGAAERQQYPGADLTRFGHFLRTLYARDGVTIYAIASFKGVS